MFDLRQIFYVFGILIAVLGGTMLVPFVLDYMLGNASAWAFATSAGITIFTGVALFLTCANADRSTLSIQQTFMLTTGVWVVLPLFGSLPFIIGQTNASVVDAFFESMSGLTTTGATVLTQLEELPEGLLLWRGLLQWFGGIGVIVVAMVFLPVLRVGGMQIFRSEGFDTFGKILPRAAEISRSISSIYLSLTVACALAYYSAGLGVFDAIVHAMTTIATGGYANYDSSFGGFPPAVEYVAAGFMILAALPFVRYVQLLAGTARPLLLDSQIRGFLLVAMGAVLVLTLWRMVFVTDALEPGFRKALFNAVSILTGTGYASEDYTRWGSFPITFFFLIGLIGGCAGSTSCSIKVFRYQLLFASIKTQVQRIHSPNGIFQPRYNHRAVPDDVISSVMGFFVLFMVTLAVVAIALALTGLDSMTSISGAAAALANIGPGLGDQIGPAGNYAGLNDTAKWILSAAMLIGRLELMAVYVIFTSTFWRV